MNNILKPAALTFALAFSLGACNKKDATPATDSLPPISQTTTAPMRVTSIETGKSLAADHHVSAATTDFGVRDTLRVAVVTEGSATNSTLRAVFTYGDKLVKELTQPVSATGGTNVTNFEVDKPTAWPKGSYKVEVFLDGVSVGTKDLTVK